MSCTEPRCMCGLQDFLACLPAPVPKVAIQPKPECRRQDKSSSSRLASTAINGYPDLTNSRYSTLTFVSSVTEPEGAGRGLFYCNAMQTGDIIGIYESYQGGPRMTASRIKNRNRLSDYALEYESEGVTLTRDAWNPETQEPCHNLGFMNDPLDATMDNAAPAIHPSHPQLLLVVSTRNTNALQQAYMPYGDNSGVIIAIQ